MIRDYRASDIDQILAIWLSASIKAHDFIESAFWESKINEMREVYIPASDTFVYEVEGEIVGFYSLYQDTLAAIFILPNFQGKGLGSILLDDAKKRRENLQLTVYKENTKSIQFYEKHRFVLLAEQVDKHTGRPELVMVYR